MAPRSDPPLRPHRAEAARRGERAAFQKAVTPYLAELFAAARRELRYRTALGQLAAGDLTPAELVGETLVRAWRDHRRRPPLLGIKAWLLALLFRVGHDIAAHEARVKDRMPVSLEATPPAPSYDDDEEFWEWYQPDAATRWEDVVAAGVALPEEEAAADEELIHGLDPRMREIFLLGELHRLPLAEAAEALGLTVETDKNRP